MCILQKRHDGSLFNYLTIRSCLISPSVPVIQSITLRRRLIQLDAARGGRWKQVS